VLDPAPLGRHRTLGRHCGRSSGYLPDQIVGDRGTLVFWVAEGTKSMAVVGNCAIAFETDGQDLVSRQAWSVVVEGMAEQVLADELIDLVRLLLWPWPPDPSPNPCGWCPLRSVVAHIGLVSPARPRIASLAEVSTAASDPTVVQGQRAASAGCAGLRAGPTSAFSFRASVPRRTPQWLAASSLAWACESRGHPCSYRTSKTPNMNPLHRVGTTLTMAGPTSRRHGDHGGPDATPSAAHPS
jgi:hypothetical protein